MNERIDCEWPPAELKIVRFNYASEARAIHETVGLGAKDGNVHASNTALIVMCTFGIVGLVVFIFETMLGLAAITGK